MAIRHRLGRIEGAARLTDAQALDFVARRYGLNADDLTWASELKQAVAPIYDGDWLDLLDQVVEDGGLYLHFDGDGQMIAQLEGDVVPAVWPTTPLRDDDEPDDTD